MKKHILPIFAILAVMIFATIEPGPVQSETASIQVESRIISGTYPNPYYLAEQEALMILNVQDQASFENFNRLTGEGRKDFLNQCLQNSWQEVMGSSKVYVRLDYRDKVYAYITASYLIETSKMELVSFESGIDDLHFAVIINQAKATAPLPPEFKPYGEQVFDNIDYCLGPAIRVMIDAESVCFDVEPQIIADRTLVPMRAIFEQFGLQVDWNETTQTARGYDDQYTISFTIGQNYALVNQQAHVLDVPPGIIGDRAMIPLRFLSASLGYNVVWVGESDLILISRDNIIEWRHGGYETAVPYKEYQVKYSNGLPTNEVRYTGKTRPAVSIIEQGIISQLRGTFYQVVFSDGFGIAVTLPKHKVAFSDYEAVRTGVDGTKLNKSIDLSNIVITGFNQKSGRTFQPLSFIDYAAALPPAIKNVYQDQDFFLLIDNYFKNKEISGLVVFDSRAMLDGIEYNDGVHSCKLYLTQ